MKIGVAIAIRREEIGMTQEELAKAVGVSKATISRWESGDISNMRRDRIQSLASALNVSPLSLLDDEPSSLTEPQFEEHTGAKLTAIKEIRESIGISQAEAARRIGISRQAYWNYETEKRQADYETLLRIAEAFGCSVGDLLGEPVKKIAALVDDQSGKDEDEIRAMCQMLSDDSLLMLREYTRFLLWREAQAAEDSE